MNNNGCRNKVEISGISNQIPDQDLEESKAIVKTQISIYYEYRRLS